MEYITILEMQYLCFPISTDHQHGLRSLLKILVILPNLSQNLKTEARGNVQQGQGQMTTKVTEHSLCAFSKITSICENLRNFSTAANIKPFGLIDHQWLFSIKPSYWRDSQAGHSSRSSGWHPAPSWVPWSLLIIFFKVPSCKTLHSLTLLTPMAELCKTWPAALCSSLAQQSATSSYPYLREDEHES